MILDDEVSGRVFIDQGKALKHGIFENQSNIFHIIRI